MNISVKEVAAMVDHTNLKAYATRDDFRKLCNEAIVYGFKSVAINTYPVAMCREMLRGTNVLTGAAISFPLGQMSIAAKVFETRDEKKNANTNINYTRSNDASIEGWINQYLQANDAMRSSAYYQLAEYITRSVGSLVTIGFERQQIITHRGVCKGIDANAGNPLYNFPNWTIELE